MRWLALFLLLISTPAWATSSIDPNQPAGTTYTSEPTRNNFAAFAADVNAQQNCNRGSIPPANPQTGYCWLNVLSPTTYCYEVYSGSGWVPVFAMYPTTNTVAMAVQLPITAQAILTDDSGRYLLTDPSTGSLLTTPTTTFSVWQCVAQ